VIEIIPIETPSLGDRTYVATDGVVAVVVDPQRDIDRVLAVTEPRGLRITHVLETHIHNDYVTGGYQLAKQVDAAYVVSGDDDVSFERQPAADGDIIETGAITIRAIATPGHTYNHLSYAIADGDDVVAVFSGGSLLYGSTGRPDLLGDEHTETLAHAQHRSARRLVAELPGSAKLYPTHGFGSFCSAGQSEAAESTLAEEAESNPVLTQEEEAYVSELIAGLDAYPAYYAHMGPRNADGPAPIDLTPPQPADAEELRRRIEAGEWVVDLRTRSAFAAGHVPGSVSLGLDGSFVTYLGWMIPWGTPVTLLGSSVEDVAEAQRDLARIGIDRPAAAATGGVDDWTSDPETLRVATFDDVAAAHDPLVVDVRRNDERRDGHLEGSLHLPLHELLDRLDELPDGRDLWVHCASGYRAALATSLLQRAGKQVIHVDDDFETAATAGLSLAEPEQAAA
jgi:hydroxyacylglutathione hydrolase